MKKNISKNVKRVSINLSGKTKTQLQDEIILLSKRINKLENEAKKGVSREINLLFETGKLLSSTLDIRTIYQMMFRTLSRIMDCDELFISSYDSNDNLIRYEYLMDKRGKENIDVKAIPPIPLAPDGFGIQSQAIRSRQSIIMNDYQQRFKKVITSYNIKMDGQLIEKNNGDHFKPQSAMIIPIKLENKVFGVVQIFSGREKAYSEKDMKLAESLIHLVALAYNNALLYRDARREIKVRKEAEEKLKQTVKEKEVLVKEVHHRVKNNLQVISSLMKFQSGYVRDPETEKHLVISRNRLKAMSLIHEKLSNTSDDGKINFEQYVIPLVDNLFDVYGVSHDKVNLNLNINNIYLDIDTAIPCGLIINELVSNSFKYAFPDDKTGNINIELIHKKGSTLLKVEDDGVGVPEGFDINYTETLGLQIVSMLSEQLNGKININNNKGFKFCLKFSAFNLNSNN